MREQGDGALVLGGLRVVMKQFVKLRAGRHRVQQQDKASQYRGDERLAGQAEMTVF